jgi:hypothetical protein
MTDEGAVQTVRELRQQIDDYRRRSALDFRDVLQVKTVLADLASRLFGSDSDQSREVDVHILSPDELRNLELNPALPKILHSGSDIPRIMSMPSASRTDYYRKRLDDLDEIASSILYTLTQRQRQQGNSRT